MNESDIIATKLVPIITVIGKNLMLQVLLRVQSVPQAQQDQMLQRQDEHGSYFTAVYRKVLSLVGTTVPNLKKALM